MPTDMEAAGKHDISQRWPIIFKALGALFAIFLIIATSDISRRDLIAFVSAQEKFILGIEAALFSILFVETLVGMVTLRLRSRQLVQLSINLRIAVRITGYSIASVSVVSILSSSPTLGISAGAIAGIVIAFATQSTVASVLATIVLISTRMVRVGEIIDVTGTRGIVVDIKLTHTVVSVDDEVAYIPNSFIMHNILRRKKRSQDKDATPREG